MDKLKKEVGKRIAQLRKAKNLKQEELKELIEAPTVQMISSWENGHSFPSVNYLIILAQKLDTTTDFLLQGKIANIQKREMVTFKDIALNMIELVSSGIFALNETEIGPDSYHISFYSQNRTISKFKHEWDNLLTAEKSMRKELYEEALKDLLEKFDIPLNK